MPTNILIYFATEAEAHVTISRLKAIPEIEKQLYRFPKGTILVGGMGLLAAAGAMGQHIASADVVWNLGVAGALDASTQLGSVLPVSSVCREPPPELDEHSTRMHRSLYPQLMLAAKGNRLITTDYPIHDLLLRQRLNHHAELVDMEGYSVAYIAQRWKKPCHMWKVVSDFASPGGPKLIQEQLASASEKLALLVANL